MEQEEKGPVCKRSSGKRHRQNSLHSHPSLQNSRRRSGLHSKTASSMLYKPFDCQVQAEFDQFNDSDVLLAEVDIEPVLSTSCDSSTPKKRKCSEGIHVQCNFSCTVDNTQHRSPPLPCSVKHGDNCQESVTDKHSRKIVNNSSGHKELESNNTSGTGDIFVFASSSHEDLFNELKDNSPGNHIANCHVRNSDTEDTRDVSLSEYFFLDKSSDRLCIENTFCDEKNSFTRPQINSSEIESITSLLPSNSKPHVEAIHLDSNILLNLRHVEEDKKTLDTARTTGKSLMAGSIKDKIKKRLQENIGNVTVYENIEESIKKEAILQAKLDASQIRKEGSKVDIGPFFGLPVKVQQLFETHRGITKLYDWQKECLNLVAVKERKNLIYTLPTSGGKTLVAEVLIMKELLCYQRDALLVLPFVSIVQEKVKTISEFATELGFLVEEYAGSKGRFPPIKRQKKKALYIATIEKAHSLVNSLIETDRMASLGLVVVDELHMVGEGGSRGATLEAMLLKLMLKSVDTQIVGMSATLNNIKDLQTFLHAELFANDFRPVTLKEYVKVDDNIFKVNHQVVHEDEQLEHDRMITFPYSPELARQDPDHLLALVMEIIPDKSCLMFCATKKHCENVASFLSKLLSKSHRHIASVNQDKKKQLLAELCQDGEGKVCPVLKHTIQFGIAYHHSGLTSDERHLIEDAYSEGTLCLLTCTSTLAAGVNLPAKRVILRSPYIGTSFIKYSQYKQMTGRAGRAGIDTSGDSILIMKAQDKAKVKDLLSGPKDLCHSSLIYDNMKGIKTLLLSAIGLKIVTSTKSAFDLMDKSLLHIQASAVDVDVATATRESLQYLIDQKLVIYRRSHQGGGDDDAEDCLLVSSLGQATFKGAIAHDCSAQLYKDLKKAEESLNLGTYLHLLYLVTPYNVEVNVDWRIYLSQFSKLTEVELKVPNLIGVPESYVGLRAAGHSTKKKVCEMTISRFYVTLMLWDLWNQKSVWEVADKFSQPRGFIQNLLSQSVAFASCVFHFCQELEEFWAYQNLFSNFIKRLAYCVTSELIPLMEIPGVKLARAKQLYAAGYKSLANLAGAEGSQLVNVIEHLSLRAAKQIISVAKNILEEKKEALLEEVESLLPVPQLPL